MSLLDDASLLVTPNAEKEGKLYSIIPSNGNGDFSVTRATTATRVNAAGLVELVPYNLLTYSEDFTNAIWTKVQASVAANAITAPNGTLTADSFVSSGVATVVRLRQNVVISKGRTFSMYAKMGSAKYIQFFEASSSGIYANFDLENGVLGTYGIFTTPTIEDVGNGWYRCTFTTSQADSSSISINMVSSASAVYNEAYIASVDNLFLWGAQFVEGTSALDYQMTETRLNIPRLDYSLGSCPNILLEPQRTNLALRSEEFDNASWTKSSVSVTANSTTSPNGLVNADTITADGTSNQHVIQQALSFTLNVAYSVSFYVKKSTNNFVQICTYNVSGGQFANFDISSGVVGTLGVTFGTAPTSSITSVGNGWYRCTMTFTASATASSGVVIALVSSASAARLETNTLSTSVFLWGAQLEAGAYATSYIPTTSASVTRNADVILRNNIFTNGLITASGGTWFVELRNNRVLTRDGGANVTQSLGLKDSFGNGIVLRTTGTQRHNVSKYIVNTPTELFITTTDICKIAIKWNGSTLDIFQNGVKVVSGSIFTTTNMTILETAVADIPKYINSMALFPTPLTDSQCIALTT